MKTLKIAAAVAALVLSTSANAWWNDSNSNGKAYNNMNNTAYGNGYGNGWGDGSGDFDADGDFEITIKARARGRGNGNTKNGWKGNTNGSYYGNNNMNSKFDGANQYNDVSNYGYVPYNK